MLATEVIKKKRNGQSLSSNEIEFFISSYTRGDIPDYQMSAWLMATFLNGMTADETIALTQSMLDSGEKVCFDGLYPIDKHSTGGVGDKTSLILAPIVAACGVPVPMMSGRGLGHTGGTLDKLESIPGFNVNLDINTFKTLTEKHGLCFIGQTKNICPADKKIYALRDVTATVESLPLICASIMSKKIAEGIRGLVLDVKFGSGAFMKTLDQAEELARSLISIGLGHQLEVTALLTNMNQPLGRFVGNSLEVQECLSILTNQAFGGCAPEDFADTRELSLKLSAQMVAMGKKISFEEGLSLAKKALSSGQAYDRFAEICKAQGGDLTKIPQAKTTTVIKCSDSGYLNQVNSEQIGVAGIELKAGRRLVTDTIDPSTGIQCHKKVGDFIGAGDVVFTIYHNENGNGLNEARQLLESCYSLADTAPSPQPLIVKTIHSNSEQPPQS